MSWRAWLAFRRAWDHGVELQCRLLACEPPAVAAGPLRWQGPDEVSRLLGSHLPQSPTGLGDSGDDRIAC